MRYIPNLLTISRALIAPVLLWSAFCLEHRLGVVFLSLYVLGFLTDVFDGPIARKLGTVSPYSAALDSQCDLLFQGSAVISVFCFRPDVIAFYQWLFVVALSMQCLQWAVGLAKFGRLVSYHTRLTKIWAVVLFLAIVEVCISKTSVLMLPTLLLAIVSNMEEIAISLKMSSYVTDVSGLDECSVRSA